MGRLIGTTTQYAWLPGLNFQNGRVAQPLISPPATQWVPRSFAICAKGRVPRSPAVPLSRHSFAKRNLRPALIHFYQARLFEKVETITAPAPLLGCFHQSSFHRIAMHVPEFLHPLLRRPYVEIIEARLPECSALGLVQQIALPRIVSCCALRKRGPCAASIPALPSTEFQFQVPSKADEYVPA